MTKALSIRQPWAHLVAHGIKDIENRSWRSTHRGPFCVHASTRLDGTSEERDRIRDWVWQHFRVLVPDDDDLSTGGIIGQANVIDVVRASPSPWFKGPFGFALDRARPLPFRPCLGQVGFFSVTP